MKNLIVLIAMVAVLAGTSLAGLTNPDGFEGYAVADPWAPTQAGQGWTAGGTTPALQISTVAAKDGSNGLQAGIPTAIANGSATWYATLNDDLQVFDMDFQVGGGASRIAASMGGAYNGAFSAEFSTWSNGGVGKLTWHDTSLAIPGYTLTNIPGTEGGTTTWAGNGWHHLTIELNFTNHTHRARFDANVFTAWVPMPQGGAYNHPDVGFNLNGVIYMDNVSLAAVPEPATMALLGLGVLLLRRKR